MLASAVCGTFDLCQDFPLFRAGNGNADAFERFGPKLADLSVTPFNGCAHGVAKWDEFRALEEEDLRLQQATAFEFDAAQRHHERIIAVGFHWEQRGRPDPGMHGMCE